MNCVLVTRQIHKTPPILKLTHNFEARVCTLKVTKGKGCALDADTKSRLASLYEPMYSPPPPSLLLLQCPYLSIGLGYLGGMKNQMQNTGEPMPKFFTGSFFCCFFFYLFFFFFCG